MRFLRSGLIGFLAVIAISTLLLGARSAATATAQPLSGRVNEAFRSSFGRNPTAAENQYWLVRVVRGEKRTFEALRGAMLFHKAQGRTTGDAPATNAGAAIKSPASTIKQAMIVEVLPLFVRLYGNDPTAAEKAWWRKRISCNEIKSMQDLENSMRYHKTKGVRKGRDTICGQKAAAAASSGTSGVSSRRVAGLSDHPMGDELRVGIFKTDGRAIHVTANGSFQVREGNEIKSTVGKDDIVQVSWSDGKYHVRGAATLDAIQEIRLVPLSGAIMQIKSYSDPSTTIADKNYNRYRGIVEIRKCEGCGELWAINELRVEYYLRGLAETSGEGPEEYIKALGAAARTYALYHKVVTGGRNPARGYHIGRTADDQIYRGYEYEIITPRMSSIFNKTKGIIVTNGEGDAPVSTVYFSDSDGRTRSAKEAWGTDRFPHLQHSVNDPHHASSSCLGHCVGMSAQGAYGLASKDNWSFQKILTYFYKGVRLVKAY